VCVFGVRGRGVCVRTMQARSYAVCACSLCYVLLRRRVVAAVFARLVQDGAHECTWECAQLNHHRRFVDGVVLLCGVVLLFVVIAAFPFSWCGGAWTCCVRCSDLRFRFFVTLWVRCAVW